MKSAKDGVREGARGRNFASWVRGQGGQGAMQDDLRAPRPAATGAAPPTAGVISPEPARRVCSDGKAR